MKSILLRQAAYRIAVAIPILFAVTLFTFYMMFKLGDPASAVAGDSATPERLAQIRSQMGFDRPILVQYFDWLGSALTGDFGDSLQEKVPTMSMLADYLPPTILLVGGAMVVSLVLTVIFGVAIGIRPGGWADRASRAFAALGMAVPNFLLGLILVVIFSVQLHLLPSGGYRLLGDGLGVAAKYMILPVVALSVGLVCQQLRTFRASLLKEYRSDYVRTARMKNLSERRIFFTHVLRNAAAPLVTVIGIEIGALVTGAILVEAVFAIQGIGTLTIESVRVQDFAVVQALVAVTALVVIGANFVADMIATWLNPAGRTSRA